MIEFEGDVTCVTDDPANHRAWIGGVITANRSTHAVVHDARARRSATTSGSASSTTARARNAPADRASFVGFEGDLEIPTSAAYCALQPWAADDARTWAVTEGNIQVHD